MKKYFLITNIILFAFFAFMPSGAEVLAIDCEPGYVESNGICLPNADDVGLRDDDVQVVLQDVFNWLLYFVTALAVIFIAYAGIQYVLSSGDDKKVEEAKKTLKMAIIGLLVAVTCLIIVRTILEMTGAI